MDRASHQVRSDAHPRRGRRSVRRGARQRRVAQRSASEAARHDRHHQASRARRLHDAGMSGAPGRLAGRSESSASARPAQRRRLRRAARTGRGPARRPQARRRHLDTARLMGRGDLFEAIEYLRREGEGVLARFARSKRGVAYADLRFEAVFNRSGAAVNGEPRDGSESKSAAYSVSVHAADLAGPVGHGQTGAESGALAARPAKLVAELRRGLSEAYDRARFSARKKADLIAQLGEGAKGLLVAPIPYREKVRDDVDASFSRDPRSLSTNELKRISLDASREVAALGDAIAFQAVAAMTEFRREIFIDTAGAVVSQAYAFSQGDCYVVAQIGDGHQESYDSIGQQRGIECLSDGWRGELMPNPDLAKFCVNLAGEARELAAAPVLTPPEGEVVVVTDPHFNALVAHEVIGHPSEADRALKMEAAYAGRSWFLRSLADNQLGKTVASPLLSACSDPSLDGYGHYRYDHEGTRGRRVMHIDRGIFSGFLNSRTTAAVLG